MSPAHVIQYVDHDFRPALPGWRAVYLDGDGGVDIVPVAGWLVQIEERTRRSSGRTDDDRPRWERPRRVVPAVLVGGDLLPASWDGDPWMVLGPDETDPTANEVAELAAAFPTRQKGVARG